MDAALNACLISDEPLCGVNGRAIGAAGAFPRNVRRDRRPHVGCRLARPPDGRFLPPGRPAVDVHQPPEATVCGRIRHERWPHHSLEDDHLGHGVVAPAGLPGPTGEPRTARCSGVDVEASWLERVPRTTWYPDRVEFDDCGSDSGSWSARLFRCVGERLSEQAGWDRGAGPYECNVPGR